jgi:hypothetical protein
MGRASVSPNDYDDQRLAGLTDFRCEKCQNRWPLEMVDEPTLAATGRKLCSVNCAYSPPHEQKQQIGARHKAELAQITAEHASESASRIAKASASSLMAGVPAVESLSSSFGTYPTPTELTIGGGHVTVTITGINFSSADTIAYGSAGIVNHAAVSRTTTTTTLTVKATSGPAGYYGLTFNGNSFPNVFRVRE